MTALVVAPRRFGADWAGGKLNAMNRLGFVLASATVLLPVDYGLQRILGWDKRTDVHIAVEMVRAMRRYLFAVVIGGVLYLVLRLFGSQRRITTTIGLLIYVTAFSWFGWCLGLVACWAFDVGNVVPTVLGFAPLILAALALEGAHRIRWWWCALALAGTGYAADAREPCTRPYRP